MKSKKELATSNLPEGKKFTRRETLKFAAAGTVMAAGGLVLPGLAQAATPKKGGHLRIGVRGGSVSDSLDPATFSDVFMRTVGYGTSNTLVGISGEDKLVPELAESWEAKPGASEWVFNIRKGVEFHSGKTLDADDIIVSIQHHRGDDSKSGMKSLLKAVKDIRKDGPNKVVFTLEGGNADFPYVFTDYRLMIMAQKDGKLDWQGGVGTGGYVLKSFEPGVRCVLERNPNYWRGGERAFVDSAEILTIPDVNSRQTALINGDIDIIDQVDLKTVHLLKRQSGIEVADTAGALHYTYPMNTQAAPFDNNDVRLAVKYALDRKELLEKVLHGYGTLGNDHPVAPGHQFFAADLEQRHYDPDKSKFHLKKAGMTRAEISLSVSDFLYAGAVDGALLYKERAAKAGIDLNVVREPSDGYFSNVWKKKPFVASYWGARPTADLILTVGYASGGSWNDSYFEHERFNKLLVEARSELNQAKRAEMYHDMQVILRDEGGTVIPLFANNVFAMSKKIGHPASMAGNWELDGGRSIERWWFQS